MWHVAGLKWMSSSSDQLGVVRMVMKSIDTIINLGHSTPPGHLISLDNREIDPRETRARWWPEVELIRCHNAMHNFNTTTKDGRRGCNYANAIKCQFGSPSSAIGQQRAGHRHEQRTGRRTEEGG